MKPQAKIVSPASQTTVTGTVTLVANASDNVAVTSVAFWSGSTKLGDGVKQADGSWSLTANSKNWPNATYAVVARATDAAGNVGSSASSTLVIKN